ncbi:hypothetical protein BaRGS_00023392, partial [Batillaria attramentaria]
MEGVHYVLLWVALCLADFFLYPGGGFVPWVEGYRPGPVRQTIYGQVRGVVKTLHYLDDKEVERYLGVPFAKPPVGELRFE